MHWKIRFEDISVTARRTGSVVRIVVKDTHSFGYTLVFHCCNIFSTNAKSMGIVAITCLPRI